MMDGDVLEFTRSDGKTAFSVDCSHVSVVFLGAFENLMSGKSEKSGGGIGFGASPRVECDYTNSEITYEDLIAAGMRREIAGRVTRIIPLHPLNTADFKAILETTVLKDMEKSVKSHIVIDDASANFLSEKAASTGLGVRWMKAQIMNAVDDLMFENPAADAYSIHIPAVAGRI